jgi:hypothetical protein
MVAESPQLRSCEFGRAASRNSVLPLALGDIARGERDGERMTMHILPDLGDF